MVSTTGGQLHLQNQYIDGNKRKIESLRLENLMKKAEKVSVVHVLIIVLVIMPERGFFL